MAKIVLVVTLRRRLQPSDKGRTIYCNCELFRAVRFQDGNILRQLTELIVEQCGTDDYRERGRNPDDLLECRNRKLGRGRNSGDVCPVQRCFFLIRRNVGWDIHRDIRNDYRAGKGYLLLCDGNLQLGFSYQRTEHLRSAPNREAMERQRVGRVHCVLLPERNVGGVHPLYLQRERLGAAIALISRWRVI